MTRCWLLALLLPGCFLAAHGSYSGAVRSGPNARAQPDGAIELGVGGSDERQWGAAMMGVGSSPLGAADSIDAPHVALISVGGRYERAVFAAHPGLRLYGRLMLGFNPCEKDPHEDQMSSADKSCDGKSDAERRTTTMLQAGFGISMTATGPHDDSIVPSIASTSLGIVYTYATDDLVGSADFLGFEVAVAIGGDIFSPFAFKKHD